MTREISISSLRNGSGTSVLVWQSTLGPDSPYYWDISVGSRSSGGVRVDIVTIGNRWIEWTADAGDLEYDAPGLMRLLCEGSETRNAIALRLFSRMLLLVVQRAAAQVRDQISLAFAEAFRRGEESGASEMQATMRRCMGIEPLTRFAGERKGEHGEP